MNSTELTHPEIDLKLPFAEQDSVQSLLGYPSIDPENTLVSSELFYNFIKVTNQWLQQSWNLLEVISGIKIGIEKLSVFNFDTNSKEYKVESQFVSNHDWRSEYDVNVLASKKITFLSDALQRETLLDLENEKTDSQNEISSTLQFSLTDRFAEELYRLYPKLKEFQEVHFYIFWNKIIYKPISDDLGADFISPPHSVEKHEYFTEARSSCFCEDGSKDDHGKINIFYGYKKRDGRCTEQGCN